MVVVLVFGWRRGDRVDVMCSGRVEYVERGKGGPAMRKQT